MPSPLTLSVAQRGGLWCQNASYEIARAGSVGVGVDDDPNSYDIGQYDGGVYGVQIYEALLGFAAPDIPAGNVVTSRKLRLYANGGGNIDPFSLQVREIDDWETLTGADWQAGALQSALPLLGSLEIPDINAWIPSGPQWVEIPLTIGSGPLFALLTTDMIVSGIEPTGDESVSCRSRDNSGYGPQVIYEYAPVWTCRVLLNGGAPESASRLVEASLRAVCSAGSVTNYRWREAEGEWGPWLTYDHDASATLTTIEFDGYGRHVVELQFRTENDDESPVKVASIVVLEPEAVAETLSREPAQSIVSEVLAWYEGVVVASLSVVDGSVSADARRAVWRTASLTLAPTDELTHEDVYELLARPGLELTVKRGWLTHRGDSLLYPLGRFIVDEVTYVESAQGTEVAVSCSDLSVRISRARWTEPFTIAAGTTVVEAVSSILSDRWTEVPLGLSEMSAAGALGAPAVFEASDTSDPWSDAQNIAVAHGFILYFDASGVARLCLPADPATTTPRYTYTRDEHGVILEKTRSSPMESVYNGVIVSGEGSSLARPVRAEAWDIDPASPTSIYGAHGIVPLFYSSSLITTVEQAEDVAESMLQKLAGRLETLVWQQLPNPAIKPLTAVQVEDSDGAWHTYIIDELVVPLSAGGVMTATVRETRVAD